MTIPKIKGEINPYLLIITLKNELNKNGNNYFKDIIDKNSDILMTCPFHSGGQEKTPSCFMSTRDIVKDERVIRAGTVSCFGCGTSMTIEDMISRLYGKRDFGSFGLIWISKFIPDTKRISYSQNNSYSDKLDSIMNKFNNRINKKEKKDEIFKILDITEEELESYRYTHTYMYDRGLTDDLIERFDIGYQSNFLANDILYNVITVPIKNKDGQVCYLYRRVADHKSKRFFNPPDISKAIFGLYECLEDKAETIYVTEGIFDALSLWKWGYKAIAMLGTGTKLQIEYLNQFNFKQIILAFDGDEAGDLAIDKFNSIYKNKNIISIKPLLNDKDVNDLRKEEFDNLPLISYINYKFNYK